MGTGHSALEGLVIDPAFWADRRVLITGHTGFKGAWMSLLLSRLGAHVFGFALEPLGRSDLFVAADVQRDVGHSVGDIRDFSALRAAVEDTRPEIVIHMAAQALVRLSYEEPVKTYETNVMGTVNLLEIIRQVSGVHVVVVVTSDKCYANSEWPWGYRESDRLGGHDPYSNSKGCQELVTEAYRRSFFQGDSAARIATVRAGNVIGGGDWARDRLVPDAMRAFTSGKRLRIRNPRSIRPWQHVLDPVIAYLLLAERLAGRTGNFEEGWNFGPPAASEVSVEAVADALVRNWGGEAAWERDEDEQPLEANYLKLDCSKAKARLGWQPLLDFEKAIKLTVEWYRAYAKGCDMREVTLTQISEIIDCARIP
jgi:CDP-glucose 4,6-dehydratase